MMAGLVSIAIVIVFKKMLSVECLDEQLYELEPDSIRNLIILSM